MTVWQMTEGDIESVAAQVQDRILNSLASEGLLTKDAAVRWGKTHLVVVRASNWFTKAYRKLLGLHDNAQFDILVVKITAPDVEALYDESLKPAAPPAPQPDANGWFKIGDVPPPNDEVIEVKGVDAENPELVMRERWSSKVGDWTQQCGDPTHWRHLPWVAIGDLLPAPKTDVQTKGWDPESPDKIRSDRIEHGETWASGVKPTHWRPLFGESRVE